MVSEDGDQLRLRHSFWQQCFNWKDEILLVHLSTVNLTNGARLNSPLPCDHWIPWILHKPAYPRHSHSNNSTIAVINTVLVSVYPWPAEQYKVSIFELVSSKTTHSSIWCQIYYKTWNWATQDASFKKYTQDGWLEQKDHTVWGCPGRSGSAHQQHCPGWGAACPSWCRYCAAFYIRNSTNDQIAQMLQMMQKTFDEQLKFQRDQQQFQKELQKCADSQLPSLEKIPVIDWTHNDGLHSQYTIWKEQWNAIFKSDYLFTSDAVKVHKLYRHIGEEGQKKNQAVEVKSRWINSRSIVWAFGWRMQTRRQCIQIQIWLVAQYQAR